MTRPQPCDHASGSTWSGTRDEASASRRTRLAPSEPPPPSAPETTPRGRGRQERETTSSRARNDKQQSAKRQAKQRSVVVGGEPAVVGSDEGPILGGQANLERVVADVFDDGLDALWRIEEDLPTSTAP